jgi:hypothetical protein
MRTVLRWIFAVVVILHGLVHLLGAVKGFGWAQVEDLNATPSAGAAAAWLVASVMLVATGVTVLLRYRWWWILGAAALVVSQVLIFSTWADARAGLAANLLLLVGVVYGYASEGPAGYRAGYRRLRAAALAGPRVDGMLSDADLAALPQPVAAYIRLTGAVGQPRVANFRARIHGRIRGGPGKPWMNFTGEQVNTYGAAPSRVLLMDATMFGLPVDVLHAFVGPHATMQVKLCSLLRMVDASGPDMDRAETVTLFNDLCVLSPAALVDAPIRWSPVDGRRVRGEFTHGGLTVAAELTFGTDGRLVDFVSDDRLRAAPDGKSFTRQRWSTPIMGYRRLGARVIGTNGEAHWHAPDPEGEFVYLEFVVDAIAYNAEPGTSGAYDELLLSTEESSIFSESPS